MTRRSWPVPLQPPEPPVPAAEPLLPVLPVRAIPGPPLEKNSEPRRALAAARASGAEQVIAGLPGAWGALLSKRFRGGQELSASQWVKVAVARGLYKNAPVLLLDEPTASMDPRAEHAVYQAVLPDTPRPDQITVLISHRLASVVECDRIFVFADGQIIETGTHQELMELDGEYAAMFTLQAAGFRTEGGEAA